MQIKAFLSFCAFVILFTGLAQKSFAVPSVKYTGIKPLPAMSARASRNKNYLKNEDLILVLKYINKHYFHGKYPMVKLNDGELLFPYGITTPTVFLRVRRLTLIKFPRRTQILSVTVGNSANFKFKKITNSTGDYLTLKPNQPELRTTMIVTTINKLYYFNLVSTKHRYMPIVGFYFPGIYVKNYKAISFEIHKNLVSNKSISISKLSFRYYETGKGYKILRVFNDGKETFIKIAGGGPLPALFIEHAKKEYLVNFVYRGGYYVLRGVPKTIILVSRTKASKKEVTIHYGRKPNPWGWW